MCCEQKKINEVPKQVINFQLFNTFFIHITITILSIALLILINHNNKSIKTY